MQAATIVADEALTLAVWFTNRLAVPLTLSRLRLACLHSACGQDASLPDYVQVPGPLPPRPAPAPAPPWQGCALLHQSSPLMLWQSLRPLARRQGLGAACAAWQRAMQGLTLCLACSSLVVLGAAGAGG